MNSSFKSLLLTILGFIIFFAVVSFFISLLPYLIIGGLVIYIIAKVRKLLRNKNKSDFTEYNTYNNNIDNEAAYTKSEDDFSGKVIDVDYKDVEE